MFNEKSPIIRELMAIKSLWVDGILTVVCTSSPFLFHESNHAFQTYFPT